MGWVLLYLSIPFNNRSCYRVTTRQSTYLPLQGCGMALAKDMGYISWWNPGLTCSASIPTSNVLAAVIVDNEWELALYLCNYMTNPGIFSPKNKKKIVLKILQIRQIREQWKLPWCLRAFLPSWQMAAHSKGRLWYAFELPHLVKHFCCCCWGFFRIYNLSFISATSCRLIEYTVLTQYLLMFSIY